MRICRAFLGPGRNLVFPEPSFEMIRRFAVGTGVERSFRSLLPEGISHRSRSRGMRRKTAMVAVVSPNNPTGGIISADDLHRTIGRTATRHADGGFGLRRICR